MSAAELKQVIEAQGGRRSGFARLAQSGGRPPAFAT